MRPAWFPRRWSVGRGFRKRGEPEREPSRSGAKQGSVLELWLSAGYSFPVGLGRSQCVDHSTAQAEPLGLWPAVNTKSPKRARSEARRSLEALARPSLPPFPNPPPPLTAPQPHPQSKPLNGNEPNPIVAPASMHLSSDRSCSRLAGNTPHHQRRRTGATARVPSRG